LYGLGFNRLHYLICSFLKGGQLLATNGTSATVHADIVERPVGSSAFTFIDIETIRLDGDTQGRISVDPAIVEEYAALMRDGVLFPPISVWFDKKDYWVSDGFQRIAAATLAGLTRIQAEVRHGTLEDAQWASYAANSVHGLRRTRADLFCVVKRALAHRESKTLSTNLFARYLKIPEPTMRRWRSRLSSSTDEDGMRTAIRGGKVYSIRTKKIGHATTGPRTGLKCRSDLRRDLMEMKEQGSPEARRLISIVGKWALNGATTTCCLAAVEGLIMEWRGTTL
jgi:hypothetical protein